MKATHNTSNDVKNLTWNIIASGLPIDSDLEVLRKFVLLNIISILGIFVLGLLSSFAFYQGDIFLGLADFATLLILLVLWIVLRKKKNYQLIGNIGAVIIGIFYLFLVAHGSADSATYLWAFTYPLVVLYLLGRKIGTIFSLSFLSLSVIVSQVLPKYISMGHYNTPMLIRFVAAYLTILLFAIVAEIIHETVHRRLRESKKQLQVSLKKVQEGSLSLARTNQQLLTEIDERKRIEKALQNSESFLDNIIESIQDGISVLNPDLTIRHTNSVMREWYCKNIPLIGKSCYECYHNMDHPCEPCPTLRCLKSGKTENETVPGLPGSAVEWMDVYSFPIIDKESGAITGAVEFVRDITKAKRMEHQLAHAQKLEAIGTLTSGVAHDLNNILSGIVSYPELLLMDIPEDSPLRKPIETIHKSGRKAAAIVQDMLTLARRGVAVHDVVNLNDIINGFLDSPEFGNIKKYHPKTWVESDLRPEVLNIVGSPIHLTTTIMNLVSNAAEAMDDGGRIQIRTANQYVDTQIDGYEKISEGEYVVLTVSDSGSGISKRDVQKIFEPFYTKKEMGRSGTGLGMTVVWGTVKDLNGFIDVRSSPGTGTTFSLYFPGTRAALKKKDKEISIDNYSGHEKILVVDDVEEQREIASALLKKLGYTVETVASGEESLEYLSRNAADIIILDMVMDPGMDGLETYERIISRFPGQKAIIASGYSETERVKAAQQLGAGDYVKKPYSLKSIGVAVRDELDR